MFFKTSPKHRIVKQKAQCFTWCICFRNSIQSYDKSLVIQPKIFSLHYSAQNLQLTKFSWQFVFEAIKVALAGEKSGSGGRYGQIDGHWGENSKVIIIAIVVIGNVEMKSLEMILRQKRHNHHCWNDIETERARSLSVLPQSWDKIEKTGSPMVCWSYRRGRPSVWRRWSKSTKLWSIVFLCSFGGIFFTLFKSVWRWWSKLHMQYLGLGVEKGSMGNMGWFVFHVTTEWGCQEGQSVHFLPWYKGWKWILWLGEVGLIDDISILMKYCIG